MMQVEFQSAKKETLTFPLLEEALSRLPLIYQDVLLLRYMDHCDEEYVAMSVELEPSEVRVVEEEALLLFLNNQALVDDMHCAWNFAHPGEDVASDKALLRWGLVSLFSLDVKAQIVPCELQCPLELQPINPTPSLWDSFTQWWKACIQQKPLGLAFIGALALIVGLPLFWKAGSQFKGSQGNGFTAKGNVLSVQLFASRQDPKTKTYLSRYLLQDGDKVRSGDLIQLDYRLQSPDVVQSPLFVMLVSVNAKGRVQVGVPLGGEKSLLLLGRQGTLPKEGSLTIDDSPIPERWFLLASERSFSAKLVKEKINRAFHEVGKKLSLLTDIRGSWKVVWSFTPKRL